MVPQAGGWRPDHRSPGRWRRTWRRSLGARFVRLRRPPARRHPGSYRRARRGIPPGRDWAAVRHGRHRSHRSSV